MRTQQRSRQAAWEAHEDLTEEGHALLAGAEAEAEEAMAVIANAKRTLKDARYRQNQVKLGRQYYRSGPRPQGGHPGGSNARGGGATTPAPRSDANMVCLKCGKVGHRAANCVDQKQRAMQAEEQIDEEAPFVCFNDLSAAGYVSMETATAYVNTDGMTTQEAVEAGCAILDGGATRTLASVHAVECLMRENREAHGNNRVERVDVQNTPVFGFGNSSTDRCVSTVDVGLRADGKSGSISIHCLDKGEGPILLSVATLRQLGAILDFSNDLLVLRNLSRTKVIKVGRSASGHQTLSLCNDLYKDAVDVGREIPSLQDYVQPPE